MEIHGSDLIFKDVKVEPTDELMMPIFKKYWPDAVYECFEEETKDHRISRYWFVYINSEAADAWDEDGWSEENDTSMIYVIWEPDIKQASFVVDDNKLNKDIVEEIVKVIC